MQVLKPRLAFTPDMTREAFPAWQKAVRGSCWNSCVFPKSAASRSRGGFGRSRARAIGWNVGKPIRSRSAWCRTSFWFPTGASPDSPAGRHVLPRLDRQQGVLLSGEPEPRFPAPDKTKWDDNRMAYHFARRGMVATAFDNPATNELASPLLPREALTLCQIWMGRCYEAISVFQKACVLRWPATQPYVDASRLAASGHSLGAKPADILGVLYPELVKPPWCTTACLPLAGAGRGDEPLPSRRAPGRSWHVAVVRPYRPRSRTAPPAVVHRRRAAQPDCQNPPGVCSPAAADAVRVYHYEKYEDLASRTLDNAELPVGISNEQYFAYAYVDAARHRFRPHHAPCRGWRKCLG